MQEAQIMDKADTRRYILNPFYAFRGWKLLPYAIMHMRKPGTLFLNREEWLCACTCDGKHDIVWNELNEQQRHVYEVLEKRGFIHECVTDENLDPVQEYRFYPARFKETVQWSITGRCNYRCRHCFMSAPEGVQGEPSWQQLMEMLDAFEKCGIHNLNLTGGEPMFRNDFWNLVDEILRRGINIPVLFSNGLLITDEFLDELAKRHMRPTIQFSFDGIGHHDWMRGVKGAEKIAIGAIRRCVARGIPVTISMVVCKESVGSIRESVNLLASLGVLSVKIGNASPQGEWKNEPEHYLTQAELYEAFLEYIPQFFADGAPVSLDLEGFFNYDAYKKVSGSMQEKHVEEKDFSKALMCGHVRGEMYVSPKGNILPCMSMVGGPIEEQFPNMLETPLDEILDMDSLYMKISDFRVSDFMEHNPECRTCEYRTMCCGGCRAIAVRDHPDDYLSKDPVTCEYYRGGWKTKKDKLLESIFAKQ